VIDLERLRARLAFCELDNARIDMCDPPDFSMTTTSSSSSESNILMVTTIIEISGEQAHIGASRKLCS